MPRKNWLFIEIVLKEEIITQKKSTKKCKENEVKENKSELFLFYKFPLCCLELLAWLISLL
jgi:hypothetical protein